MFEFCSLASGSSGNSSVLILGGETVLIDAGISLKKIETHLAEKNIDPARIGRLLVTHAHGDHIKSAGKFARKYRTPVYLTRETYNNGLREGVDLPEEQIVFLREKETFGKLKIKTFRLPHDESGNTGFLFEHGGFRVGYFTDLGIMPERIFRDIQDCDFLFLEANHDVLREKTSRRPQHIIERNLSDKGHLSNEQAARIVERVVRKDASRKTKAVMLAHISKDCNHHFFVERTIRAALKEAADAVKILMAPEGKCSEHLKW
ncbi:metallohydrolase [Candidatus Termititenax dinenymphae]|uniref:Metallohydrolase n=1 Tax=Candidatus Termititenax dinenymphae TaxID=2218523 RepID=A0A388TJH7_9BACT|nr:metallohydrolase [Candidatus Termititenax dinenymphae]